ncbi:serine hydrolase [Fodinibius sp.]|uniref:serine hydrolase domain-containing protein n=1 Tax=Fodinibius sp. TaxID=1872440 RepID=UPI002ACD44CE|nr:serine hydrolase [Fodinibius sp.]MDZ7659915.1 serine hydrolase [Fodinibius sp.]
MRVSASFIKAAGYSLFLFFLIGIFNADARSISSADSVSLQQIQQSASSINSVTSLLIQQNGKQLAEFYFNGMEKGEPTNIKSASKSIISLLVGIAVENGYIKTVNQPIEPYFEDYFNANPDSIKESITIKDLLTMRSGLETTSFHNYGRWVISDNWIKFALDQPLEKQPGGDMAYSTGTSHLLSVIISKATGMSTRAFAEEYLFHPMNIKLGGWDRDPQGYYMGGNNMALAPDDMIKIGQMLLNRGRYNGQRIVSKDWIVDSFKTYTRSNYNPYDYGYMWWNKPVGNYKVYFAWGYGGQYIFIIPKLDATIVLTGALDNATQSRSYKEPVFDLLDEQIIPYLKSSK